MLGEGEVGDQCCNGAQAPFSVSLLLPTPPSSGVSDGSLLPVINKQGGLHCRLGRIPSRPTLTC